MKEINISINKLVQYGIIISLFLIIMYLSVFTRMGTFKAPTVLDYDPWWHYRHALELLENNLIPPEWDILSFYPPGRPSSPVHGWEYMMVFFYKIMNVFTSISFMDAAKLAPVIVVGLTTIPAFFLGRMISNNWGGLATALFATLTPTFIGVSMAGYSDSDAPVVLFSFLSVYSVVLAIKKKKIFYTLLSVLVNVAFIYTWFFGHYVTFFFILFIPMLFIFRIIERSIHEKRLVIDREIINQTKRIAMPIIIIFILTNIISFILGFGTVINFVAINLSFISGTGALVDISVAELQVVNPLTRDGFNAISGRIGIAPTLLTLFALPALVVYKIFRKDKINFIEIFLFLWALLTFYMILNGVRFSLQFSIAAAVSAGYVIGNVVKHVKRPILSATAYGLILILTLLFISNGIQAGYSAAGMQVSSNWLNAMDWLKQNADKDALIATWWDPGHIIAGYTGLKVHADGAHCGVGECVPYNHDIRIQDMGRIFSTNNEEESVQLLNKYRALTPAQCQQARDYYGDVMPEDACKPVTEIYVIASSDLIGKYHWMSFFGLGEARNFFQMDLSNYNQEQGILEYADGTVSLVQKDNQLIPVYQGRYIIKEIIFYQNGEEKYDNFENNTNMIDGMLWVDPGFRAAIYMQPEIKDSVFTRMFFWNGEGLEHFDLVYQNPEMKIFKVIF